MTDQYHEWICQQCYDQVCRDLGVTELWVYTISNPFDLYQCERCGERKAVHLIDKPKVVEMEAV